MNPDILHKHLIIRSEVKNPFTNVEKVDLWLNELTKKLNMKVLLGPFSVYCDRKGNEGVTGFIIIETSHIALHIWDRCNPAIVQLDVYTCGQLNEKVVFDHLLEMNPIKIEWKYIDRMTELKLLNSGSFGSNSKL